jgi:hypothetical protein
MFLIFVGPLLLAASTCGRDAAEKTMRTVGRYPKATLLTTSYRGGDIGGSELSGLLHQYATEADKEAVFAFYLRRLADKGWQVKQGSDVIEARKVGPRDVYFPGGKEKRDTVVESARVLWGCARSPLLVRGTARPNETFREIELKATARPSQPNCFEIEAPSAEPWPLN